VTAGDSDPAEDPPGRPGHCGPVGHAGPAAAGAETEAALVRACADGDREAWIRFVKRFGPLVSALARRMLARRTGRGADADVDEVTSGVFLALVVDDRKLLQRYRPEFRLSTYLGVICRTEVGRYLRHLRPGGARGISMDDPDEGVAPADPKATSPLSALMHRERDGAIASLRRALDAMGPRDRLLLTLKFIDGLDYGRIAVLLGIHRDSVGQLLHRAKERLAACVPELAQWVDPEEQ
jgi:RNA polymerase sigma factor (sigma-70 family)